MGVSSICRVLHVSPTLVLRCQFFGGMALKGWFVGSFRGAVAERLIGQLGLPRGSHPSTQPSRRALRELFEHGVIVVKNSEGAVDQRMTEDSRLRQLVQLPSRCFGRFDDAAGGGR